MNNPSRADIEAALAREPDNIAIVARLALVCLRGGDVAAAAPLFERIIAERANDIAARINLAGCLMRLGRADDAVPHIAHAAGLMPGDAAIRSNHAQVLRAAGQREAARGEVEEALRIDPRLLVALSLRAELAAAEGDDITALGDLDTALTLKPNDAALRTRRAAIRLSRGDWLNGLAEYEARLEVASARPYAPSLPRWQGEQPAAGQLVLVYAEQGDGESGAAVEDLKVAARHIAALAELGVSVALQAPASAHADLLALSPAAALLERGPLTNDLAAAVPVRSLPFALSLRDDAFTASVEALTGAIARDLFTRR
ncbi:MAG: tetratricopeptide repeat protein [Reyranellaceae bacterium]